MKKGNEFSTQGGKSDRVKQCELERRAKAGSVDHLQSLVLVKGGTTG